MLKPPSLGGLWGLLMFRSPAVAAPMPLPEAPETPLPAPAAPAPISVAPPVVPATSDPKTRRTGITPALMSCIIAACMFIGPATMRSEGKRNAAYYDSGHVPTICWGHTGRDVRAGMWWTDGQCHAVFDKDQQRIAVIAARCTPTPVIRNKYMMGSVIDFSFNGGPGLYCKSVMMREFWAKNYTKACIGYTRYVYATDRRTGQKLLLKGLVSRRDGEMATCMKGVK